MSKKQQIAFYAAVFVLVFTIVFVGLIGLDMLIGRDPVGLNRMFGRNEWPQVCDENNVCVWITTTPLPTPGPATVQAIETFYARVWATDAAATAAVVDAMQPVAEDNQ